MQYRRHCIDCVVVARDELLFAHSLNFTFSSLNQILIGIFSFSLSLDVPFFILHHQVKKSMKSITS